jgi:DNA-binding HxlR family transcriptional regulator
VAERTRTRRSGPGGAPALQAIRGLGKSSPADRLIRERLRLAMVSALAVNEKLSFSELREILDTSDGNLSVHARKLEEAGYIECAKYFADRVPRTEYRLTAKGKKALAEYLDQMEALVRTMRGSPG